ncbi:MAG: hypothetical protein CM15mP62_18380 [Rhodospirillaceae bacterium]|nr:MAG: hypothetical protein CM15mP62_18380 [Rhodospirillaceae bacterium]
MSLMQFIPVEVPMPPLEFALGDWPIYWGRNHLLGLENFIPVYLGF